jgi:tellurite resistance protein TerC
MDRFAYLRYGLGLVLAFIGAKMLAGHWVEIPVRWSLAVVASLLAGSVVISWLFGPKDEEAKRMAEEERLPGDWRIGAGVDPRVGC